MGPVLSWKRNLENAVLLGRLWGWGAGGLNLGVRSIHAEDADTCFTVRPKHPPLQGHGPWMPATLWAPRGSLVLSRAPTPSLTGCTGRDRH